MKTTTLTLALFAAVMAGGCISVKTESEIKPIHITMDVNLKVDRELDKAFEGENVRKPFGNFKAVKEAMDRKAVGMTRLGMLEARPGATDNDKILVAEENPRRLKRYQDVAKSSGVSLEAVQKRHVAKLREHLKAGCGVWVQDDSGAWRQL